MDIVDFQQSTAAWGQETFGKPDAGRIARRMNVEMAELLISLDVMADRPPLGLDRDEARQHAGEECADVFIMLVQVAAALGVDLGAAAENKMLTNRSRTWGRTPTGMVQHVENPAEVLRDLAQGVADATGLEVDYAAFDATAQHLDAATFKEPGSGLFMEFDKWYVLSDSGSAYSPMGFASVAMALAWCQSAEGREAGADTAVVPKYNHTGHHWTGQDGVNILCGGELYDFWMNQDPMEIEA